MRTDKKSLKKLLSLPEKGEKNVVIISFDEWNKLSKDAKNAEYLNTLDRSFNQLQSGKGTQHELIKDEYSE